ncbi:MAG: DUF5367 family protein [Candidatus Magasanikbacteria bacterium]
MKYLRAGLFGLFLWIFIFVIISVLMFLPGVKDSDLFQNLILWVLLIPFVMLLAKWYFRKDEPTSKKGLMLGIVAVLVGTLLDMIITVPVFVKSFSVYYSDWTLYIGMLEVLVLTTYAGYEFDATFTVDTDK